ncbi:MAG: ComF family protein [Firmicutes bacterium]|nr:ComF family protein [Bacillota bacterium]
MYYFTGEDRLSSVLENALQLLFPMGTYCICCGRYIDLTRAYCICDRCMASINWGFIKIDLDEERKHSGRTEYLDSALSCMVYGMHSKRLVFDLKYNKKTYLARPLSMIMTDRILNDEATCDLPGTIDFIVPIPLHRSKQKNRGFNQAALISAELTARLNHALEARVDHDKAQALQIHKIRHLPNCLRRDKPTIAQRSVTGGQRFTNLEGAFSVDPKYETMLEGSSVLLVDDIFTTGATADRCARVLKETGVSKVHLLSLATGNYYLKGSFRRRDDEDFLDSLG